MPLIACKKAAAAGIHYLSVVMLYWSPLLYCYFAYVLVNLLSPQRFFFPLSLFLLIVDPTRLHTTYYTHTLTLLYISTLQHIGLLLCHFVYTFSSWPLPVLTVVYIQLLIMVLL